MSTNNVARVGLLLGTVIVGLLFGGVGHAFGDDALSAGETVYVPVYSHIYVAIKGHPFDLAISLSIRNTNPTEPIAVLSVDYYDSNGKLIRKYLKKPVEIAPLGSVDYFVSETDTTGGFGASFLVKWKSEKKVNKPIIEGVMAGTKSGQGISFTSRGRAIREKLD
jgi:hypothetical protein